MSNYNKHKNKQKSNKNYNSNKNSIKNDNPKEKKTEQNPKEIENMLDNSEYKIKKENFDHEHPKELEILLAKNKIGISDNMTKNIYLKTKGEDDIQSKSEDNNILLNIEEPKFSHNSLSIDTVNYPDSLKYLRSVNQSDSQSNIITLKNKENVKGIFPNIIQLNYFHNSEDFYINYLDNVRIQSFISLDDNLSEKKENLDNLGTNLLNESTSTTHTAYTINSPKGICNRYSIRSLYDNYLENKYPEIMSLQKKYSHPFVKIDMKKNSFFFIIKSFNIENIHKAIKYGVWSTTYSGNILFDKAYSEAKSRNAEVYLFFSTNSTFAFQGIAKLKSKFQTKSYGFWKGSDKYKSFHGSFLIDWLIIKDVPNATLDKIFVNNIPFSKLRNGVQINEQEAVFAVNVYETFYFLLQNKLYQKEYFQSKWLTKLHILLLYVYFLC